MRSALVGVREHGHGLDVELAARPQHTQRDLAAIGDENAAEHQSGFQRALRFSRNALIPSWPSGDARRSAMVSAVRSIASAAGRIQTFGMSALAAAMPSGAAAQDLGDVLLDSGVELGERDNRMDEADLFRALRTEAHAGQEQLARGGAPDFGERIRRDHRRQDAQLHLREPERGAFIGHDEVADSREPRAATERGAVNAADERHGQSVEQREHACHRAGVAHVLLVSVRHHLRHPRQVRSGAKDFPGARQDDASDRPVGGGRLGPARQLDDDMLVEGVANVRPVQRDVLDASVASCTEELEGHGCRNQTTKRTKYRKEDFTVSCIS